MMGSHQLLKSAITLCLLCGFLATVNAQNGTIFSERLPEAQSQDELDLYLEIVGDENARTTIEKVNQFALRYPASKLLGLVFQDQMRAFQKLNDYDGVLRAGNKSLQLQPNNLNTLLVLSMALPNGVEGRANQTQILDSAEGYARTVLKELKTIHVSPRISLERWEVLKGEMQAQAHEALGYVAVKRGRVDQALMEFETAAANNPTPQGSQFFRLGACYILVKKFDKAEIALHRAIDLGPEEIRAVAYRELEKVKAKRIEFKNIP